MPLVWDRTRRAWQLGLFSSRGRAANRLPKRSRAADRRLAVEPLEERQMLSVSPTLLKDVAPGALNANPGLFAGTSTLDYFVANDGTSGVELWRTDGTSAGTQLVKDIAPGAVSSLPHALVSSGGVLFFAAAGEGTGSNELWRSDGTPGGTYRVKDIRPGPAGSSPTQLVDVNGTLYFVADNGTNGAELWRSDGTDVGTVMVKDINLGPGGSSAGNLVAYQNQVFFEASNGTNGAELWRSNGTDAGTVMVKDIDPGPGSSLPFYFTEVNGELFFSADNGVNGTELWKTNGTGAGTVLVKDVYPGGGVFESSPHHLTKVGNRLFFIADDGLHGDEPWLSNGTEAGTVLVKDINLQTPDDIITFGSAGVWLTNVNGVLFFQADDGLHGRELWRSDGTEGGTTIVKDLVLGSIGSEPVGLVEMFNTLYFTADDGINGREPYFLATSTPQILANIRAGSGGSNPDSLTAINGTLYFSAEDGINGNEPWRLRPFNLSLSNRSINENAPVGTLIGTLTNPGSTDTYTYELYPDSDSGDNSSFSIVGDKLNSNAVFNYEAQNLYSVGIKVNNLTTGQTFWIYEPITIVDQNDPPVAIDDLYSNPVGQQLVIGVPAQGVIQKPDGLGRHDYDEDGSQLHVSWYSNPSHGTVSINADGTFTYTPTPGYRGRDSFTYKVNDGGVFDSNVATVTINALPVARPDFYQLDEDTSISVPAPGVLTNDVDYDGVTLQAQVVSPPAHAASFTLNPNGSFFYQPVADFFGIETFTYTANDPESASLPETVQLTVVGRPDPPDAKDDAYGSPGSPIYGDQIVYCPVLANDYNPDRVTLTVSRESGPTSTPPDPRATLDLENGVFKYTPGEGYDGGEVTFVYKIADPEGRSDTATVTIKSNPMTQTILVDVPANTWEEAGLLVGQGLLTVPAAWPTDLVVELSSDNAGRIQLPATTAVIPAGEVQATFDINLVNDSVVAWNEPVTIRAKARGLWPSTDTTTVHDNDANNFVLGPVASPQYAGLPFSITATAYNKGGPGVQPPEVIVNYNQTVPIQTTNGLPVSPAAVPFSGGTASVNVAVLGLGTNVQLVINAGGYTGTSNPFLVTHGTLTSFAFNPVPASVGVNSPFPVTITAQDQRGYPVLTYNGVVQLSGWIDSGVAPTVAVTEVSDQTPDWFEIQNVSSYGVNVQGWRVILNDAIVGNVNAIQTPKSLTSIGTLAAGEVRYWTDSPTDQPYNGSEDIHWGSGTGKGWVMIVDGASAVRDFLAWGYSAAELQSITNPAPVGSAWSGAGVAYAGSGGLSLSRFGGHDSDGPGDFLWQGQTKGVSNPMLVRPFAAGTSVPITPAATTNFVNGRWTGDVTVQQMVAQMYLWSVDSTGIPAFSSRFNVGWGTAASTPGAYDPATSLFYLRNSNTAGYADYVFGFGPPGGGWRPIAGDWNGDGVDTVGLYDPDSSIFYLSNSNQTGVADVVIGFGAGNNTALPVAGDWNGDGIDTIGIYEKASSVFYLRNSNTTGVADMTVGYGEPGAGWLPLSGDWDGDHFDALGLYAPQSSLIYIKGLLGTGYADWTFGYGEPGAGWLPFSGDWKASGSDGPGVYDPNNALYYERFLPTPGYADWTFGFGAPHWLPVAGDWNGPALLMAPQVAAGNAAGIEAAQLQGVVAGALERWSAAGLQPAAIAELRGVEVVLADLPEAQLGRAAGSRIYIDRNAAGYGWFVDSTPADDVEYAPDAAGRMVAVDPRALDRMDLLTVVAHEMGHVAGLDDLGLATDSLMSGLLTPGLRRSPGQAEADALFADSQQNWL